MAAKKPKAKKKTPKLKLSSTQMWSPIKDIKDGVVVTKDGRYVQILEFAPTNFQLLPVEEQDAIADTFGAAIRTFPDKFQIKVLSRKANVETHVRNLQKHMEKEKNPKCRAMQEDSIRQIKRDAMSGVSRRFFVSYEYDRKDNFRRPEWNDIYSNLSFTGRQIAGFLATEPCSNELLTQMGDNEHTMDILYGCMCRAEAEYKSLETKINDIVCGHIVENGYDPSSNLQIPVNDFLAPRQIDPSHFTYTVVDGKYYAFGYLHRQAYPQRCVSGWLAKLINLGEGIDLDIWVEKRPTKETASLLTYSMQLSRSDYLHKSNASADLVSLETKMDSEEYIRQGLSNEQDFMYFSIMLTVVADSERQLKSKFRYIEDELTAYGLDFRPCHGNHDLAFRSSLPICSPAKQIVRYAKRNILSGDFGAAYPFTSYEINDPNGIMIGKNIANNSPLFLDFFNRYTYSNGNGIIFGSTGSGKTFGLQCIGLRLREYQTQTIIIAPYKGHEFRRACDAIGGTFITLAPGSTQNINIMEIRKYDTTNNVVLDGDESISNSILSAKIQQIRAFFSLLIPELSRKDARILDEALLATYKKFGITERNKSLLDPLNPQKYKPMPTLGDLDAEMAKHKDSQALRDALAPYVTGSAKSFNGPTNVNLDNPYVVIDVSNMPDDMMPIAIFIATDYVYDTIRADRVRRKAILIDELSRLVGPAGTPEAGKFVLTLFKTVRAYSCICIGATQDINDFFALKDGYYGKGILANAKIKLLMKQEPQEADTLTALLHLSKAETRRLTYFQRGEGLLIANRNHAALKIVASQEEFDLIATDTDALQAILERKKRRNHTA